VKKVLFIVLPLILLIGGGVVLFLGWKGIIKLPFFPQKKVAKKTGKQTAVAKTPAAKKPDPVIAKPDPAPPKPKVIPPKPDIEAGEKKLALVWNTMEAAQLVPIVQDWKDPDLAKILVRMDEDKVTELLAALDPVRASRLSRAIETVAAKPKPVVPTGA